MTELPLEIQLALTAALTWLVVNGLKALSELIHRDLTGWGTIVAAILSATVIFFFTSILKAIPPESMPVVGAILALLVSILGSMGFKRTENKALGHASESIKTG